jgi:hypothetical protein
VIGQALIIGVAEYLLVDPDLPGAVHNDVRDVADALCDMEIGQVEYTNATILVDRQATAAAIRDALERAAASLSASETFLFYFSGHGTRGWEKGREQSWLLPYDTDPADLAGTALSSDELVACLDAIAAKRQVIMIDACHAGGIGSSKSLQAAPKGFGKSGVDALSQGTGRVLLTSSRPDEYSGILYGARNSVFTTALLDAMCGGAIDRGDGMIGVLDVFDFVSREVPRYNSEQHPIFHAGDLETNFAIARRKVMVPPALGDLNSLAALFASLYPSGPRDDHIWVRSGGNLSRLDLTGSGHAQWHSALAKANAGGGGLMLSALFAQALADFPGNADLEALAAGT